MILSLVGKSSRVVDMIFVMGSSKPNGRLILAKQKEIAKYIINLPNTAGQHYGVIQYDSYPSVPVRLGYIRDKATLKEAIDLITWRRDGTAFIDALRIAADQFKKEGRPNADSILVVFSDGKEQGTKQELSQVGAVLRKNGITVYILTTDEGRDNTDIGHLVPDNSRIVAVNITDPINDEIIDIITGDILSGIKLIFVFLVLS